MTKLEELIQELCPDGVEFFPLEQCCNILDRKRKPVTKSAREAGDYPYYGANGIQDYVSDYIFDGTFILVGEDGSVITDRGTPVVTWASGKIWVNNHAHIIEESGDVLLRYLYHYIQTIDVSPLIHGNIPKLTGGDFKVLQIPVPPLPVQREIVRILDNFTELTVKLTVELDAELTARKQQYAYYRDKLLTHFSETKETKICKLADVCESIADGDHMPPPKAGSGVPFITISNITEQNKIDFSNTMFVPHAYYDALAEKRKPQKGDILYTVVGSYGIPVCIEEDDAFVFQRHIAILRPKKQVVKPRYMFHAMQSSAFKAQADKAAKGAAQKTIGLAALAAMKLAVPPLDVQTRLVNVLDNFDAICTDLNIGLPTEIEARKKQYEFYRDQLLTFAAQGETILTDRQTDEYNALIRLCQYVFGHFPVGLSDISTNCDNLRKPVTSGNREAGDIPYYGASGIVDHVKDYIFDGDYLLISEDGANLLARNTPIAFSISGKSWVNNHAHILRFDNCITQKYVEIYLNAIDLSPYISGGAQPKLNQQNLYKIPIPLPPFKKQREIVEILNHFNTLCADLSAGLPAEIEARQKQYEYYRERMLTFHQFNRKG